MKLKEKLQLAQLKAKSQEGLTDEEQELMASLEEKANEAGLDVESICKEFALEEEGEDGEEAEEAAEETEEKGVTDEELKSLIGEAVKDAVPSTPAVDADDLVEKLKEASTDSSEVEEIVKKHSQTVDTDAIIEEVKKSMPDQGITKDELVKALDEFSKSTRTPKRVEHSEFNANFPVEHRLGNLPVSQKQLLNLMVMNTDSDVQRENVAKGSAPVTDMNDGITDDQLKFAALKGEQKLKSIKSSIGSKALTSTGSSSGDELVPTDLSSDLQSRFYLESAIAAEFAAGEIAMPTQPYELPLTTTRPTYYLSGSEPTALPRAGTDPTESSPGTAKVTLTAKKLLGVTQYSYEADEDAILAILPMVTDQLTVGAVEAFEDVILNGDATGTSHMDTGSVTNQTTDRRRAWDGLRRWGTAVHANLKSDLTAVDEDNLATMRKAMGKWGINPADLVFIVGPKAYNDLMKVDAMQTIDKVGNNNATLLTGTLGSIFGIKVLVSAFQREDLTAAGIYDGSTTTQGSIVLVNRPQFVVGARRGFTVEVNQDKLQQSNQVIASFRRAFAPLESPSASNTTLNVGYNYTA
tara:strand:+ start:12834 stop:14573 length:1740 start_codon:yes stop_codon:yes gene_type:complete